MTTKTMDLGYVSGKPMEFIATRTLPECTFLSELLRKDGVEFSESETQSPDGLSGVITYIYHSQVYNRDVLVIERYVRGIDSFQATCDYFFLK